MSEAPPALPIPSRWPKLRHGGFERSYFTANLWNWLRPTNLVPSYKLLIGQIIINDYILFVTLICILKNTNNNVDEKIYFQ